MPSSPPALFPARAWSDACTEARCLLRTVADRDVLSLVARDGYRFGPLIRALAPTALGLDHLLARPADHIDTPADLLRIAHELAAAVSAAHTLSLTAEIRALLTVGHDYTAVGFRLGLLGETPMTFQDAASRVRLSAERIRQKKVKLDRELRLAFAHKRPPYTPILDRALTALTEIVGDNLLSAADIEHTLRDRGVLTDDEHVSQIVSYARLMRRPAPTIAYFGPLAIVGSAHAIRDFQVVERDVRPVLDAMTRDFGATSIDAFHALLEQVLKRTIPRDHVLLALRALGERVEWIVPGEWLRLKRAPSRYRNYALKILAVAPEISLVELRRGLLRSHRIDSVPPAHVLVEILLRDLVDVDLTYDGVWLHAETPPDLETTLGYTDFVIARLLQMHGGAMTRLDLETMASANGIQKTTLSMSLSNSPIVDHVAPGVYALRGACVDPDTVADLLRLVPPRALRYNRTYGILDDGRVYLCQEMGTPNAEGRFNLNIPLDIRSELPDGVYRIRIPGKSKATVSEVSCSSRQIRFSTRAISPYSIDPGDFALFIFDPAVFKADLMIGDEDVIDRLPAVPTTPAIKQIVATPR